MSLFPDVSGVRTVIGVDAGTVSLREADHLAHALADHLALPATALVCTHLLRTPDRRGTTLTLTLPDERSAETTWHRVVELTARTPLPQGAGSAPAPAPAPVLSPEFGAVFREVSLGDPAAVEGAAVGVGEAVGRVAGRAVVFPGVGRLTGTVTVADVLALSAVERVVVLGTPEEDGGPDPATPVLTREHVRPEWRDGRLTLALVPAVGGALAPFEVPDPTPCCADHA
ncbi:hypothetical protein AB0F77_38240 [Streptomyces sp. NPDC026672]|uniref:hypothetical protein n=1 Tax=unclassified Streptomyces TaxID=2593676 RepID=UPI0033CF6C4E